MDTLVQISCFKFVFLPTNQDYNSCPFLKQPSSHFQHTHVDIICLFPSDISYLFCFTAID